MTSQSKAILFTVDSTFPVGQRSLRCCRPSRVISTQERPLISSALAVGRVRVLGSILARPSSSWTSNIHPLRGPYGTTPTLSRPPVPAENASGLSLRVRGTVRFVPHNNNKDYSPLQRHRNSKQQHPRHGNRQSQSSPSVQHLATRDRNRNGIQSADSTSNHFMQTFILRIERPTSRHFVSQASAVSEALTCPLHAEVNAAFKHPTSRHLSIEPLRHSFGQLKRVNFDDTLKSRHSEDHPVRYSKR